ncbi:acetyl-CoA carboxylase biotin carboxylase subunit family protein [Amycolatopsis sp. NPDC059657]|uniref:ATP-grasp domain-containing protein n=1 Tax=Amycolatopsis sp. NPDC059657 TaxID=3346899 RepID=UPI0036700C3B
MFNQRNANSDRYLLVLGADILLRERAIVSALRSYPGQVLGMAPSPDGQNRFFDDVLRADYYNAEDALAAVRRYELETGLRPEAVVPIIEMTVHVSVAISQYYGLSSLSEEAVGLSRDKHTMKAAFEQAGVPTARHRTFSTLADLQEVSEELTFPLVLKPRDFAGNTGTIKVDSSEDLPAAYDHCRDELLAIAPLYDFSDGRFQAEEFVRSTHEISVEVLNYGDQRAVLAVTDKAKLPAPHFTEIGQLVPSRESDNDAVRDLGVKACEALGITRGIAHVEILVNGSELSVVEVAARPGGDGIMDLIDRVYGFSPYDLHYASYLNTMDELPKIPREPRGIGAIRFLKAPVGTITAVNEVEQFTDEELALYVTAKAGDRSHPASSYLTRDGVMEFFRPGAKAAADPVAFQKAVAELAAFRTKAVFTVAEEGDTR